MMKFSYWGIKKHGDWYDAYFSTDFTSESIEAVKAHSKNKNVLFSETFSYIDFVKEFEKFNIEHKLFTLKDSDKKIAIISANDIGFLLDSKNDYEFSFIEVIPTASEKKIENFPNTDIIESMHRDKFEEIVPMLDNLGSTLMYILNDGRDICLFCKSRELIDIHLIELFNYRIKDLKPESKDMFTDKIILQIMNYSSGSNEISEKIKVDDSGSVKFQLSNKLNDKKIRTCDVTVNSEQVIFSDWKEESHRKLTSFRENRKGQFGCVIFVLLLIIGLYYLIKFLIG